MHKPPGAAFAAANSSSIHGPLPAAAIWPPPPGDRAVAICVTTALFVVLTGGFLAMRAFHKYRAPYARYAIDDVLLMVAMLLFLGQSGLLLAAVKYGYGEHIAQIIHDRPASVAAALKLPLYAQAVASFALCFAKLSVGATLLHLCRGVTYLDKRLARTYKVMIVFAIVLAVLGNVITVAFILTGCSPGQSRTSLCRTPPTLAAYIQLGSNLAVNLLFVFSTMWLLRKLKLGSRDRLAIDLLLCFMFSASITSIIKAVKVPDALLDPATDLTWEIPVISILLSAEICLSIMAACLPSIRRVLGRHFPSHWRFWHRGEDDGLDLVVEGDTPNPASGTVDVPSTLPGEARASHLIQAVAIEDDKSEWGPLNRLESGVKPLGGLSVDEISSDEKNKEMSMSEPHSERNTSQRSSARLSWS